MGLNVQHVIKNVRQQTSKMFERFIKINHHRVQMIHDAIIEPDLTIEPCTPGETDHMFEKFMMITNLIIATGVWLTLVMQIFDLV